MSDRREIIHKALIRANAIDPRRLLDDEIDTAAHQLDSLIPDGAVPTDAQADEAVKRGEVCKKRHFEREALKKAQKDGQKT